MMVPSNEPDRNCLPNKGNDEKVNQQTTDDAVALNHIQLQVGNKQHDKASDLSVEKAFVMQTYTDPITNHVELRNLFDIALIFPTPNTDVVKQMKAAFKRTYLDLPKA